MAEKVVAFKTPKEVVATVQGAGIAKGNQPWHKTLVLGFLAGAFIAFGGLLAIIVGSGSTTIGTENPGLKKFIFAGVFPVGLMLVVIAGAELFTGNTACVVPAWINGDITYRQVAKNWGMSYLGNFIGSVFVAYFLAYAADLVKLEPWHAATVSIAVKKIEMDWSVAFFRAIGCNWLVCLAVWLALASNDIIGKIWGIWFPIMAFVACGFEHCIANMFFVPLGLMNGAEKSFWEFLWNNLIPVTLGNIIGGSVMTGVIYWYIYMYEPKKKEEPKELQDIATNEEESEED